MPAHSIPIPPSHAALETVGVPSHSSRGWSPLGFPPISNPATPGSSVSTQEAAGSMWGDYLPSVPATCDPMALQQSLPPREQLPPALSLPNCTSPLLHPLDASPSYALPISGVKVESSIAQTEWLYANLAAQQAQALKLQQELQMLRALAAQPAPQPMGSSNTAQWLAVQLQQAQAAAALSSMQTAQSGWLGAPHQPVHSGPFPHRALPGTPPNDGLTHKERRRRRRAQEREAAARLALAACGHASMLPRSVGASSVAQGALLGGLDPLMLSQQLTS
ncbi:hypothetical protein WJX73_010572 [Symbiochloris irregularis]|uniref:Uncharacterized protein n=1 Tax=Symbiochloris irregularis TaxID=706552 RepID=A0AAW1P573_9CHLO